MSAMEGRGCLVEPHVGRAEEIKDEIGEVQRRGALIGQSKSLQHVQLAVFHEHDKAEPMLKPANASVRFVTQDMGTAHSRGVIRNSNVGEEACSLVP